MTPLATESLRDEPLFHDAGSRSPASRRRTGPQRMQPEAIQSKNETSETGPNPDILPWICNPVLPDVIFAPQKCKVACG